MEKNSLLLIDNGFASQPSNGCHLLIHITEDSFSYAIIDQYSNTPKVLFSIQHLDQVGNKISTLFSTDSFLSLNFASIRVAVQTSNFMFLPEHLYDKKQTNSYLKFLNHAEKIEEHKHQELKIITLIGLNSELKKVLPEKTVFLPILSPLWTCINKSLAPCFLVDFGAGIVTFLYQKDANLIFQNSFAVCNLEEFNYFLLLVKQQLGLEETTSILMQGLVDEGDDYANCLKKYFLEVRLNLPKNIAYNKLTDQMPQHYFNTLLAIQLCE